MNKLSPIYCGSDEQHLNELSKLDPMLLFDYYYDNESGWLMPVTTTWQEHVEAQRK